LVIRKIYQNAFNVSASLPVPTLSTIKPTAWMVEKNRTKSKVLFQLFEK